ncbi:MAG: hypothetical protein IT464_14670 [Planctomycetes bacterium]|nr:hypothetical protein [Planctomycetota bacterium]
MHRNLLAVAAVLSVTAFFLFVSVMVSRSSLAQDREAEAQAALAEADAAFDEKRYADAASGYREVVDELRSGQDRNRAITRTLVSLAEAGDHARMDGLAMAKFLRKIDRADTLLEGFRMAALYYAGRDHDYHVGRNGVRDYELDTSKLEADEARNWRYVNTAISDVDAARSLMFEAWSVSKSLMDQRQDAASKAQLELHVAVTLEYCDLLEVNDRLRGGTRNEMHFFGSDYGIGGKRPVDAAPPPVPEEFEEDPSDEPTEREPAAEAEIVPSAVTPAEEPFTRRGYYLQPQYPSLPTIEALFETATRRAEDLKDKAMQATILYRRAVLMLNVGLYGSAELNAALTDWRNGAAAAPDMARDPRPLLRKLLREHSGSIWDDEARFLLGYIGYYLNDFPAARAEFAQLEKDYPKSRYIGEARRLIQVIEFPQVFTSFSTGGADHALVAPGEALAVSIYARNVESVNISLRPLKLGQLLASAPSAEHVYNNLAELEKLPGFEDALGASVLDQSFKLNAASRHFYDIRESLPLFTGAPGVYVLEIAGGPVLERKLVQVADLSVQRRRLKTSEQFWVTTRQGRPLANALIRGGYHENLFVSVPYRETVPVDAKDPSAGTTQVTRFREERRLVQHEVKGATDVNGLFETILPPHEVTNFWAAMDVDGTVFLINHTSGPGSIEAPADWIPQPQPAPQADLRAFVYSDRPVYRPGDTAWLRLITRAPVGQAQLAGQAVVLRVLHSGVEQYRAEVVLNEFGCATARFEVPVGAPVGDYQVLVQNPRIGGETTFRMKVLEYFKKDVKLEILAPVDALVPGSSAEVPIVFSYHAGGAVQGSEVTYRVSARAQGGKAWQPMAGRANTNLDGRVLVALNTDRISRDAGGQAVTLTIEAEGTGPGGQVVHAQATARISGSGISVTGQWPQANWQTANHLPLRLRVSDSAGKRLRAAGEYTVWRVTDQTSLLASDWANPSIRSVSTQNFDDAGRADSVAIQLPATTGRYYIQVRGSASGESFTLTHRVLLVSRGELDNRVLSVLPEFDSFDLTTPGTLLLCQPAAGDVLLSHHANGFESGHRVVVGAPALGIHELLIGEGNAPHCFISARAVRWGGLSAAQYGVSVRPASRSIQTSVRFDQAQYKPGEIVTADIITVDHRGEPVQAEVALSVWDSALKEFASSALEASLYDHFYSGVSDFVARDENLGARTRVSATRRNDARVKRWRIYSMPTGSFFYGAQSWTTRRQYSLLEIMENPDDLYEDMRVVQDAVHSMSENWDSPDANESPNPYYGESSAVGLGGGGGGRGGAGGLAYRRARGGGGRPRTETHERSDFRDSAYFNAEIRTNEKGFASISFTLPDNLTEWTFEATASDRAAAIGQCSGTFKAARDLSLRMVGPRGLTEGDEVELSALVQNLGKESEAVTCRVTLNVEGSKAPLTLLAAPSPEHASVLPGMSQEVRFRVKVGGYGLATLKVEAVGQGDSDSLVWKYAVAPRGVSVSSTSSFRFEAGQDVLALPADLPKGVLLDRSSVSIQFHGSLIGSVVDALPGLVNYPYGCAEQTTNKFVPLLSVLQLLKAYNLDVHEIGRTRVSYNGVVEAENWPAQLSNSREIQKMVDIGFGNLRGYQNGDGGWGWFGNHGSSPHLSATVLAGLCSARQVAAGIGLSLPATDAVMNAMFLRGAEFLLQAAADLGNDPALRARALYAAAWAVSFLPLPAADEKDAYADVRATLLQRLIAAQAALGSDPTAAAENGGGSAGLATLALALHHAGRAAEAKTVVKSLLAQAEKDSRGMITFPSGSDRDLAWHDVPVEAHALAIQAIATVNAAEPVLQRAVQSLLDSKSGGGWGNTRSTGQAIAALSAYLEANKEQAAEVRVGIRLGAATIGTFERTTDRLLSARTRWDIRGDMLREHGATVSLARSGTAAISGSITVRAFLPVDKPVAETSNGVRVTRTYSRRTAIERDVEVEVQDENGRVLRRTTEKRVEHKYANMSESDELKVGDIVSVTIQLVAKPGERYFCIEDARPSCFEPISSRYERVPGLVEAVGGLTLTKEERDTTTNFYAADLDSKGQVTFRYDCVVVAAGKFTALPARAFNMYNENHSGHSNSTSLTVK